MSVHSAANNNNNNTNRREGISAATSATSNDYIVPLIVTEYRSQKKHGRLISGAFFPTLLLHLPSFYRYECLRG